MGWIVGADDNNRDLEDCYKDNSDRDKMMTMTRTTTTIGMVTTVVTMRQRMRQQG
jgi:hypothetical protein